MQWAGYGLFSLVAVAGLSQAKLQLLMRNQVLAHASETGKFDLSVKDTAKRGRILSADNLRPLAMDEDSYVLQVKFSDVPHSAGFYSDLAAATGLPATEFQSLAESSTGVVNWGDPLSEEQAAKVRRVKYAWRANGLAIFPSHRRSYPLAEAAAGITGSMVDGRPASGLEASQNTALGGRDGVTAGMVDRTGAILPMRLDKNKSFPKTDGVDIQTTIDFDLQQVASRAIRTAVEKNNADTGSVVIMDPKTGDVLAMANWPSFDPMAEGGKGPGMTRVSDFNSVMQGVVEPGSTFKLLTLAEALDKGVVTTRDHFDCSGHETVGKRTFQCDKGEHHGDMLIGDVIAKSCNVTASKWSRMVGHDDFFKYLENLGLLDPTGIGLPHEGRTLLDTKSDAPILQLALLGFGQSINVAPIRLAAAFSMLGNDGKQMFPRLITRIGTKQFPPEVAKQVVKPDSAHLVVSCMEAVMDSTEGTGYGLRIPGYRLAGKTGTAERVRKTRDGHVSNFVGFVPAPNPKALILVMIDKPKAGAYYGAAVAGPVFKELAGAVIRRFAIPPTESATTIPPEVAALMLNHGAAKVAEAKPATHVAAISGRARRT